MNQVQIWLGFARARALLGSETTSDVPAMIKLPTMSSLNLDESYFRYFRDGPAFWIFYPQGILFQSAQETDSLPTQN